jgi:TatD DNase family protein
VSRFIDSHAHLADPAFDVDRDAVLARARQAGAEAVVCIGESPEAAGRAQALAARHPGFVFWTSGIHPHDAAGFRSEAHLPVLRGHLAAGAVAVGECGLDYHYEHSPRPGQREAFAAQIALARETGRPLVVHTREAAEDTASLVAEAARSGVCGVLHCFTGPRSLARAALDAGWYLSFSGIITFKKWDDDELLRVVPDERLLVESDSPYLAPVPHRGRRNEPAWVALTVERLASARASDPDALGVRVAENARRLFALATAQSPSVNSTASG